jgi:ABC-type multidrug transport system fused ATPase/permease subunit
MARAILRNSKILIIDKATASVDAETDALIQDTVRSEFGGVTVLSIAHRLHTIDFYDKVSIVENTQVMFVSKFLWQPLSVQYTLIVMLGYH